MLKLDIVSEKYWIYKVDTATFIYAPPPARHKEAQAAALLVPVTLLTRSRFDQRSRMQVVPIPTKDCHQTPTRSPLHWTPRKMRDQPTSSIRPVQTPDVDRALHPLHPLAQHIIHIQARESQIVELLRQGRRGGAITRARAFGGGSGSGGGSCVCMRVLD